MIVYMAQNMMNGKVYIDQTVRSLDERKRQHLHDGLILNKNYHFYNAPRKYGKDSFSWNVLCECSSVDELNQKEIEFIAEHRSTEREFGYNLKSGGLGGHHSDETKEKIRIANTGYRHSEDAKRKMSVAKSGENHPHYGKSHTKEWNERISMSHIGIRQTPEAIEKIRQKKIGFRYTEDTNKRIGLASSQRVYDDIARNNMSMAQKKVNGKSILMIDKISERVVNKFDCINDAVRFFGKSNYSTISCALSGRRPSAYGYKWKYAEEENSQSEITQ